MVGSILPLRLEAAAVRRGGNRLVGPVDIEIGAEGVTMVIGPNGSGKTSLLRLMHGLERAAEGRVRWAVPRTEALTRQAYVFQNPILMRRHVVGNIAYPLLVHGVRRAEARRRAAGWAEKIGLGEALERPASSLSGGERQKLALARALIRRPEILFLDEPCANLDGRATREIEAILAAARDGGTRIETFGRVTFVAVTRIQQREIDALAHGLARHFVDIYGAPSVDAALGVAREEMAQMADLCEDHPSNTLLTVSRELTEAGVKESFRAIEAQDAGLEQFAIHGDPEGLH